MEGEKGFLLLVHRLQQYDWLQLCKIQLAKQHLSWLLNKGIRTGLVGYLSEVQLTSYLASASLTIEESLTGSGLIPFQLPLLAFDLDPRTPNLFPRNNHFFCTGRTQPCVPSSWLQRQICARFLSFLQLSPILPKLQGQCRPRYQLKNPIFSMKRSKILFCMDGCTVPISEKLVDSNYFPDLQNMKIVGFFRKFQVPGQGVGNNVMHSFFSCIVNCFPFHYIHHLDL